MKEAVERGDIPALEEALLLATRAGVPQVHLSEGAALIASHYKREERRKQAEKLSKQVQADFKAAIKSKNLSKIEDLLKIAEESKLDFKVRMQLICDDM